MVPKGADIKLLDWNKLSFQLQMEVICFTYICLTINKGADIKLSDWNKFQLLFHGATSISFKLI